MSGITDFLPLWGKWYLDGEPIRKTGKDSPFLGKGSFGDVWRIYREDETGRYYAAVKHISIPRDDSDIQNLIADGILTNWSSAATYYSHEKQTLKSEIMAMQKLQGYTNIVSYSDDLIQTKPDGIGYDVFLRMELLTPLENFKSGMKKEDVVQLGIDISTAIDVINKHGLVHRDIKPQNIFVNATGDYKLGDFGTARALKSEATAMSVKGTYNYMSPEVFNHKEAGNTVDIYSLGLVLYRLLNRNRLPFLPVDEGTIITSDMSEQALARRFSGKEEIPAPVDADPSLAAIVLKCCEFDPHNRWQSGSQLKQALLKYQSGERKNLKPDIPPNDQDLTVIDISFSSNTDTRKDPPQTETPYQDKTVSDPEPRTTDQQNNTQQSNTLQGNVQQNDTQKKRIIPIVALLSIILIAGGLWFSGIISPKPPQPTLDPVVIHTTETETPSSIVTDASTLPTSYTITWIIGSETDTTSVSSGETPTHSDPIKSSDAQYTYTFKGWSPDIKEATQDATYKAIFQENIRSYTITWLDDTGKTIGTTPVAYGDMPFHTKPTKASNQQYTYSFSAWQPEVQQVTGDATYKATFKSTLRAYTITWQDDTNKTIGTTTVAYGDMPFHTNPTKASDQHYTYSFSGWQPDIQAVTGDATYQATFKPNIRSYTITWQDDSGHIIDAESFAFGTTPTHTNPVKQSTKEFSYSFSGWQPEVQQVTGDATYKATFKSTLRTYTITWQDDTGKTIDTTTVFYGNKPVHTDPTKTSDQQYSYSFSGWQPEIKDVTGDTTYKAVFKPSIRSYTITWQDESGKTIDTTTVAYGDKPVHKNPIKATDLLYVYSFSGWQPEIQSVTGDATYKASFKRTPKTSSTKPDVPYLTNISSGSQAHMKLIQDQTERVTAYTGPGEEYAIVGKYAPADQVSITAYFVENGWVFADLSFKGTEDRMVYLKQKLFDQVNNIPVSHYKRKSTSGIVTRDAIPRFGPDTKYHEASQYKVLKDTKIEIFIMHNGYVFAEYMTSSGKVRMWLPLNSVTIPARYNLDKVEAFVKRCYQHILNRNADQDELNNWTKQIIDGKKTPDQVARGFFFSSEFKKRNINNTDLVKTIYKIYANRDADSTGLSNWTRKLNNGTTLKDLLDLFTGTDEYNKVMHSLHDDKVREFVNRCYQHILNRTPGQGEVDNWIEQIMNGQKTPDQVARGFFFSSEFKKKSVNNQDLIKIVYKIYMNRDADQQGISYWTRKLNGGHSLDNILNELIKSDECKKVMATIQ